LAVDWSF
ncbi:hypothetical protein MK372_01785, partial [Streptococcus oralis]|nr:hypothetical protein [Streptococcus oralis]